ncbi:hypothetical protein M0R45_033889 [Rubus argutus]|uniref:Translocon-associated protein subunit beta n=1 Tax=Rubus argutus TaxID=59490 RepID=A0AAW1WLT8_RUBAR
MAKPISKPLILTLLALLFTSALGSSDSPFIVAHKKASLNRLKSGAERVSVSIDIYNQGSSTAYDVSLSDESWPQDLFDIVSGNISKSWERLDAGGTISHSFELEAKQKECLMVHQLLLRFAFPQRLLCRRHIQLQYCL